MRNSSQGIKLCMSVGNASQKRKQRRLNRWQESIETGLKVGQIFLAQIVEVVSRFNGVEGKASGRNAMLKLRHHFLSMLQQ